MNILRIIWLLVGFWAIEAHGTLRFEHWTVNEGLSQNSVRFLTKDHQGYMWFATDEGLNRFDGYEFKVYRPKSSDPYSISSSSVGSLYVDEKGVLWVGTWTGGLNRYDATTESFTRFNADESNPNSISDDRVNKTIGDGKDGLWIATANGLNHFNKNTNKFTHYFYQADNQSSLGSNDISDIHIDKFERLWVATNGGGISLYDAQRGAFRRFTSDEGTGKILSNSVSAIISSKNHLWIATDKGMSRVDIDSTTDSNSSWQVRHYVHHPNDKTSIPEGKIRDILIDRNQKVWIGVAFGGVCKLDNEIEFVCYKHDPKDRTSLSRNDIWSMYLDAQQNLWVGTQSGGVNRASLVTGGFSHQFNRNNNLSGLSDNNVWAFLEDSDGAFWIGTEGGLNRIEEGKVARFVHDINDNDSLAHNYVHAIAYYDDQLWVGTHNGLSLFDKNTSTFKTINLLDIDQKTHSSKDITSIRILDNGRMWVATGGSGLFYYDPVSEKSVQYRKAVNNPHSISGDYIFDVAVDEKQNLWIGTNDGGLNYFDVRLGKFTRYMFDANNSNSPSSNNVAVVVIHSSGDLFLGSDNGLDRFNIKAQQFRRFGKEDGLANEHIRGIVEDEKGNLWLSTNLGLSYLDLSTNNIINYDVNDGLQSNEFKPKSYYRSSSGEIFFGGVNGYNHFFSSDIVIDQTPPQIVFTDFLVANRSVPISPLNKGKKDDFSLPMAINFLPRLTLSHKQNLITFEFSGIHYSNPKKNKYAYRLLGLDDDWIYTDANNRRATYSNLPAGDYVLEVKGSNRDGIWTPEPKQLVIEVMPPPWRTWWAYLFYFCLGMLPVFIYVRAQRREIRFKKEQNINLEQTVAKRTAELEKRNEQIEKQNKEIIEAQHQMVQSEKMASLGTLTAGVAHEVNNPNNFVYVSAQNLAKDVDLAEAFFIQLAGDELDEQLDKAFKAQFAPLRESIATIKDGSMRIQTIVKDLRTFTQLDNAERNEVVLTDLVTATVNLAKAKYLKLVTFDCQFSEHPVLLCYPAQLNQVFMNLIVNACHAIEAKINQHLLQQQTQYKGSISIMTYVIREQAVIEFIDDGIGFDETIKQKICEPFYTTKDVGEGTGLGLSISYGIIQKHNGRLLINSTPGVGSSFKVVLPLNP